MKLYGFYPAGSFQNLRRLEAQARRETQKALREACREFEALFLQQILKGFDRTISRSGLFPDSLEARIYRDFFYQELARELSGRGTGIADLLYRELSRNLPQERLMPSPKKAEKGGRNV